MTGREFFNLALVRMADNPEAVEFAKKELDKRNKAAIENEPHKAAIIKYLSNNPGGHTQMDIGEAVNISSNKAGALARQMVEDGQLVSNEIKIPKVGKRKIYEIVPAIAVDDGEN